MNVATIAQIPRPIIEHPLTDWVDREICAKREQGDVDVLLEWRLALSHYESGQIGASALIKSFHSCRLRGQDRFYLLFFRFRRWMEAQFIVETSDPLDRFAIAQTPLNLEYSDFAKFVQRIRHTALEQSSDLTVTPEDVRIRFIQRA
ncbi:MAG: hypothetical protein AAF226_00675 [Verrucomicrobiota bacterium]